MLLTCISLRSPRLGVQFLRPRGFDQIVAYNAGMTREARANLIFGIILFVLMAPGFVLLMRKKLSGSSEPNYMPQAPPHAAAYMQPPPVPPSVPRVEPAEVKQWLTNLLHDRVSPTASVTRGRDGSGPAISDRFTTQLLLSESPAGQPLKLHLLFWDTQFNPDGLTVSVSDEKQTLPLTVETPVTWVDVPKDIRRTLQHVGYIDPPTKIAWVTASALQNVEKITQVNVGGETIKLR